MKGFGWDHKHVRWIYCDLKLNLRMKTPKRSNPLSVPDQANQMWAMNFMADQLWNGKFFRTLNTIYNFSWEGLAIDVDFSMPEALY